MKNLSHKSDQPVKRRRFAGLVTPLTALVAVTALAVVGNFLFHGKAVLYAGALFVVMAVIFYFDRKRGGAGRKSAALGALVIAAALAATVFIPH